MKKILQLLTIFIFISPNLICQGTVETHSFNSPTLGVTKNYKIYLPPDYYQSSENYPVVYLLRNHENEWFNTGWRTNGKALKQVMDELLASGLVEPMILVGPNTGSNDGSYYGCINLLRPDLAPAAGIGTGNFEDYIVNDLVNHIDTAFRTIADKQHRGIDGFSMGGFVSTVTALRNPGIYSSIGSYDGTLLFYNLDDPGIPGAGADDILWMTESFADPLFNVPRDTSYMLMHSVTNILESADTATLNQIKSNRYHISHVYKGSAGNYWRNKNFVEKLNEKGIRNSWGNPALHSNFMHTYEMADYHATASLIKHWQTFNGTKISAPTLVDFSITESNGKDREIEVFNYGPGNLTVNNVQLNSPVFSLTNLPSLPVTLQPETETLTFSINFSPPSNQSFTDTAYLFSDDPSTPVAKLILRGKGGSFKAIPGNLYAASNTNLYLVTTDTLNASLIGNYGNFTDYISELSVNPTTKELFGLGRYYGTLHDLYIINSIGGEAFAYQYDIDCGSSTISAIAFGSDSLMYLGRSDGEIYSLNIKNPYYGPPINFVGSSGLTLTAMAINPINGQLWASSGIGKIYKINISTGDTIFIGNTGLNKVLDDIVFDYKGTLFGLVGSGGAMDTLVTIDTTTAIATQLGSLNTNSLLAIAISPDNPVWVLAENNLTPNKYWLSQNYPNPFNPSTKIKYSIPQLSNVVIKVFDILGKEIETLVNEEKPAGSYEITWYATNLSSGIYFYRLQAGDFSDARKMILMK